MRDEESEPEDRDLEDETDHDLAVRLQRIVLGGIRQHTDPGVPPEAGEHVFERFVKTPGRRESSGLGLSIVAAIAKAHGGRARIARNSGTGARFEIALPVSSRVPVTSS